MEDPTRLLNAQSGASGLERELLASLPSMGPPEGAKARAWEALAVQLAAASMVGAGVSTAKASTSLTKTTLAAKLLSDKALAIVVVGGLAVGGGTWALLPTQESAGRGVPRMSAQTKASAPDHAAQELAEDPPAEPTGATPTEEAVAPSSQVGKSALKRRETLAKESALQRQDSLNRESALLKQAREQLRAGNAKAAQTSLDFLASEFPAGVLGQEREVLAIAVLSAQGQVTTAQQRARAFVKAHPRSPHSATLRELLEKP